MKRYKIEISEEVSNGKSSVFNKRGVVSEGVIFQAILHEEQIDIMSVMRKIVEGKGALTPYGEGLSKLGGPQG